MSDISCNKEKEEKQEFPVDLIISEFDLNYYEGRVIAALKHWKDEGSLIDLEEAISLLDAMAAPYRILYLGDINKDLELSKESDFEVSDEEEYVEIRDFILWGHLRSLEEHTACGLTCTVKPGFILSVVEAYPQDLYPRPDKIAKFAASLLRLEEESLTLAAERLFYSSLSLRKRRFLPDEQFEKDHSCAGVVLRCYEEARDLISNELKRVQEFKGCACGGGACQI